METISHNLETYGYVALFLYSLGGGFVGLVAAGALSALGYMQIFVAVVVALIANIVGSQALFFLGRFNKKEAMAFLRKHRRKLALSHLLLRKHGSRIIILQKFIYGLKTLVPIAVGLTHFSARRFLVFNTIGAILWAIVFGFGSFFASEFFAQIAHYVSDYPFVMPIVLAVIIGGIIGVIALASRKKPRTDART